MGITEGGDIIQGGLFDRLKNAAQSFLDFLDAHKDEIITFANNAIKAISDAFTFLYNALKPVGEWMAANQKIVIPFLQGFAAAIGAVLLVAPILVIALNPFLLVFAAIAIAVGLLYTAWQNNFLGIQTITKAVLGFLLPYIESWWEEISLAFKFYWDLITAIWNAGSAIINYNWKKLWDDITSIFTM